MNEGSAGAKTKYIASVRPIYAENGDVPIHIATCFLIELACGKFLITAAHVIDEIASGSLYVGGHSRLVQITEDAHNTVVLEGRSRRDDHFDYAFVRLSEKSVADLGPVQYIRESEISRGRISPENRVYVALGYPYSKNKRIKRDRRITPIVRVYGSLWKNTPQLYSELGLSGDEHLTIAHDNRSRDTLGVVVNSVYPRGMSGGPLFDLGQIWRTDRLADEQPFPGVLIAMLIEYYEKEGAGVAHR